MKRLLLKAAFASVFLHLWGCGLRPPSSLQVGHYNTATGLPLYASERVSYEQVSATLLLQNIALPNPAGFPDDKVIKFNAGLKPCRDTFRFPDLSSWQLPTAPGTRLITPQGLAIDEAEITNLDWRLFVSDVFPADSSSADVLETVMPDVAALPVTDYYDNPYYDYYPVVGISYEQAKLFCKWRTDAVNGELARSSDKRVAGLVCEYRLPTEAEWEEAAGVRSGHPYGITCTELPVRVAAGAAAYLQKRAAISTPVPQIRADIAAYNRQHPTRSWINHAQAEPYFLRLATPGYVYQGPANALGLYQLLGNVAEMVEERGITKGGSYRDSLEACGIKARGHYSAPLATVGFRAVCTVQRVE